MVSSLVPITKGGEHLKSNTLKGVSGIMVFFIIIGGVFLSTPTQVEAKYFNIIIQVSNNTTSKNGPSIFGDNMVWSTNTQV